MCMPQLSQTLKNLIGLWEAVFEGNHTQKSILRSKNEV